MAPGVIVEILTKENLSEVSMYDSEIHTKDRQRTIKRYIEEKDCGLIARNGEGHICGYAFMEKKPLATRVGPLYADNACIAKKLLTDIVRKLPENHKIHIFFPEENQQALHLLQSIGFSFNNCIQLQLLWTRTNLHICRDKVYSMVNACDVLA